MSINAEKRPPEEILSTAGRGETFAALMERHVSRRGLLKGGAAAAVVVMAAPKLGVARPAGASPSPAPLRLAFESLAPSTADQVQVAAGHQVAPLLRWGDPILPGAPDFDPENLTAEAQAQQFGYNCDFVGFMPLPVGSNSSDHGLLVVNHEYTNPELMFAGYDPENPTQAQVDVEMAAHGMAVVEIRRGSDGRWQVVRDSSYNRRTTATTEMGISGPAAGHDFLKTADDPNGTTVLGTLNNCAAGKTPWGTVLSAEENFQDYFNNLQNVGDDEPRKAMHQRYGLPEEPAGYKWANYYSRFDVNQEINEPFRFGWVVEIDPYDPASTPVKRTALGRFRHEAATTAIAPDGRVVLYCGDDARFEYVYKFVTAGSYNAQDRAANMGLLDEGTLYVARFNDDGSGEWLPLVHGQGLLTSENGFENQGDVVLRAREAGDLLGATKMDRPEDIERNPVNGKVYMVMTNNNRRAVEENPGTDTANPRPDNQHGHIIEVTESGDDYAATAFNWSIFMLAGDPADESTYFAGYPKELVSSISSPDNINFDLDGNLWISTDGQPNTFEVNDSFYAVPVAGEERGYLRRFFNGVVNGEVSGPEFTPDNTTLFLAIQHPGEDGTWEEPLSTWPDGRVPSRPSVVVVWANDGGRIGIAAGAPASGAADDASGAAGAGATTAGADATASAGSDESHGQATSEGAAQAPAQSGSAAPAEGTAAVPSTLPTTGITQLLSGPAAVAAGLAVAAAGAFLRRRSRGLQGSRNENADGDE